MAPLASRRLNGIIGGIGYFGWLLCSAATLFSQVGEFPWFGILVLCGPPILVLTILRQFRTLLCLVTLTVFGMMVWRFLPLPGLIVVSAAGSLLCLLGIHGWMSRLLGVFPMHEAAILFGIGIPMMSLSMPAAHSGHQIPAETAIHYYGGVVILIGIISAGAVWFLVVSGFLPDRSPNPSNGLPKPDLIAKDDPDYRI